MCSLKTNDYCATPQQLKDEVSERYPGARQAYLKTGGDFPFLSRPDEVNLHLQVCFAKFLIVDLPLAFGFKLLGYWALLKIGYG